MGVSDASAPAAGEGQEGLGVGSSLCTRCGLCCMGVIHNNAVLDEDEIASATALGLSVKHEGRPLFALPCPRLAGTLCSVYSQRPRVCGRYRCRLLRKVEAAEMTPNAALGHVEHAKSMAAQVREAMPPGMTLTDARTLLRDDLPKPASFAGMTDSGVLKLKLLVTALHLYLDRHIRHEDENRVLDMLPTRPGPEDSQ